MGEVRLNRRKTTEQFIAESKVIHNSFYDYSKTVYVTSKQKLIVICPVHGDFEVAPHHHTAGIKCRQCSPGSTFGIFSTENADAHKEEWESIKATLYFLEITDGEDVFYKVGVTTKEDIQKRLKEFPSILKLKVLLTDESNLYKLSYTEKSILSDFKSFKYKPKKSFRGKEECFSVNPLDYYYNYKF